MVSSPKNSCIVQIPSNRLEVPVTVHESHEDYQMSQMNRCGSHPSSDDGQLADKPRHELGSDDNV